MRTSTAILLFYVLSLSNKITLAVNNVKSYERKRNMRVNSNTGAPVAIYNPNYEVTGSNAEEKASSFILDNLELLQLNHLELSGSADTDLDLYLEYVSTSVFTSMWTTVRYRQIHHGIPVYGSNVVITFNKSDQVKMVAMNYEYEVNLHKNTVQSPKQTVETIIHKTIEKYAGGESNKVRLYSTAEKVVLYQHDVDRTILAWRIIFEDKIEYDEKEVVYDDKTGDIILEKRLSSDLRQRKENDRKMSNGTSMYKKKTNLRQNSKSNLQMNEASRIDVVDFFTNLLRDSLLCQLLNQSEIPSSIPSNIPSSIPPSITPTSTNSPSTSPTIFSSSNLNVTVLGAVFDPDPISRLKGKYGDSGLTDNNDGLSGALIEAISLEVLPDIDYRDGLYTLKGPYATIVDYDAPFYGLFEQSSPNFLFQRSRHEFEAVNCYYHIDKVMRYVNEELGINVRPTAYAGGVRYDPHALGGLSNAIYSASTQQLLFGIGDVDAGEDADVIIHELGHGLHHWLTGSGFEVNQNEGLSEGFSDYLAVSYSRSKNLWTPDDPEYNWVFKWWGHNEFWPGRVTNAIIQYPDGLSWDRYISASIWSSCSMKIWDAIGREKSDKANLIGLSATGSSSNQEDLANAVFIAANDLGYPESDITVMKKIYNDCGYKV